MIRKARFLDINEIYQIEKELFGESLGLEFIANDVEQNNHAYYYVCELNAKVVGFISSWVNDNTMILNFGVLKEYRRQGIGDLLLKKVFDVAQGDITLEVRISNTNAINFYKKRGFKEVTIRKNYYSNGEDALLMLKEVS